MKIEIYLSQSDLKEYLNEGFFPQELSKRMISIDNIRIGSYSDEFRIDLKGDVEDLIDFLSFYEGKERSEIEIGLYK